VIGTSKIAGLQASELQLFSTLLKVFPGSHIGAIAREVSSELSSQFSKFSSLRVHSWAKVDMDERERVCVCACVCEYGCAWVGMGVHGCVGVNGSVSGCVWECMGEWLNVCWV
jgi:hypothetical protein